MEPLNRLTSLWTGLPSCSLIIFRHIQKTGGTSIVDQFYEFQRDGQWTVAGYWSPCYQGRGHLVAVSRARWLEGLRQLAQAAAAAQRHGETSERLLGRLDSLPWHARQFFHLHHPDATFCGGMQYLQRQLAQLRPIAPALGCRLTVAMLVREPWPFYVSWYYYIGARRCGYCPFEEFLRLNLNAQSHLALGGAPRIYSDELRNAHERADGRLTGELRTVLQQIDVLGVTERIDEFMVRLCERAGIRTCPRPGTRNFRDKRSSIGLLKAVAHRGTHNDPGHRSAHPTKDYQRYAPNGTSGSRHRRAAASAGWLDEWMYPRSRPHPHPKPHPLSAQRWS